LTQISSLAFAPDGKTLISRGMVLQRMTAREPQETKYIRFWDLARGKELQMQLAESNIRGLTLAPNGRILAATADDESAKTIRLWETDTGRLRGQVSVDGRYLCAAAFSPDGNTLASGDSSGTVWLWDTFSGKELVQLQGHGGWVCSVAFSPDGKTLASGSMDTTVLVWDVSRFTQRGKTGELQPAAPQSCWKDLGGGPDVACTVCCAGHAARAIEAHTGRGPPGSLTRGCCIWRD
jgi:WD40 repeat protein